MFETSLVESSKRRTGRRWLSLPLSVVVHFALVGSAVAASAWFVEDVEEPPGRVVFGSFLPEPPPGPAERPPSGRPPEPRPAVSPDSQPPAVPTSLPEVPSAPPSPETPGSDRPGVPGGVAGGPGERPGPGTPPGFGSAPPKDGPPVIYHLDGQVAEPVEISRVQPDYPESARKARLQGTVVLEAVISRFGAVESVRVVRSVHPILDAAAAKAVTRWRYEPARFDGRAVPVYLTVTVRFQLE